MDGWMGQDGERAVGWNGLSMMMTYACPLGPGLAMSEYSHLDRGATTLLGRRAKDGAGVHGVSESA
jgi:hypothetical protein